MKDLENTPEATQATGNHGNDINQPRSLMSVFSNLCQLNVPITI